MMSDMGHSNRSKPWWAKTWGGAPTWGWLAIAVGVVGVSAIIIAAAARPAPSSSIDVAAPVPTVKPLAQKIAFLGDSYTDGAGAESKDQGYTTFALTGGLSCLVSAVFGEAGTGYANAGSQGGEPFTERVDQVIEARPDIVVVQGSTNDHNPQTTQAAANTVFSELRKGLPKATIIALGPVDTPRNTDEAVISAAIKRAADANNVRFISPMTWVSDRDFLSDGAHVGPAGHQKLGAALRAALLDVPGVRNCQA